MDIFTVFVGASLAAAAHSIWYDLQGLWSEWVLLEPDEKVEWCSDRARGYLVFAYLLGFMAVAGTL